jgi:hypothetical protein
MIAGAELLPVIPPTSTNPANEVAMKLTGRDYISWSAISTFRTCPLKFRRHGPRHRECRQAA